MTAASPFACAGTAANMLTSSITASSNAIRPPLFIPMFISGSPFEYGITMLVNAYHAQLI